MATLKSANSRLKHDISCEPLKALVRDVAQAVERPLRALGWDFRVETRTGDLVALAAAQLWAGSTPPLLSSFEALALEAAATAAPALPRALLLEKPWPGWLETAQRLACRAVVTHFKLMDAALVQRLHGAGMRALVYTVNTPADLAAMRAAGVDGVITDEVERYANDARAER